MKQQARPPEVTPAASVMTDSISSDSRTLSPLLSITMTTIQSEPTQIPHPTRPERIHVCEARLAASDPEGAAAAAAARACLASQTRMRAEHAGHTSPVYLGSTVVHATRTRQHVSVSDADNRRNQRQKASCAVQLVLGRGEKGCDLTGGGEKENKTEDHVGPVEERDREEALQLFFVRSLVQTRPWCISTLCAMRRGVGIAYARAGFSIVFVVVACGTACLALVVPSALRQYRTRRTVRVGDSA
eukprot:2376190-Rhodomonas_salina.4